MIALDNHNTQFYQHKYIKQQIYSNAVTILPNGIKKFVDLKM
jgi:hypothetical protein